MRRTLAVILAVAVLIAPGIVLAQANGPIVRTQNMQVSATALGNGNSLDTSSGATAGIQYVGGSAVLTMEASQNGTTWTTLPCYPIGSSTVASTFTVSTTPGMVRCNVAGIVLVRARISTYTSGSITVLGLSTSNSGLIGNGF